MSQFVCTVENCDRAFSLVTSQRHHSAFPHATCEGCGRAFIAGSGLKNHQYRCKGIGEEQRRPLNFIKCAGHQRPIAKGQTYIRMTGLSVMRREADNRLSRHPKPEMRLGEHIFCSSACFDLWMSENVRLTAILHD